MWNNALRDIQMYTHSRTHTDIKQKTTQFSFNNIYRVEKNKAREPKKRHAQTSRMEFQFV